MKPVTKEDRKDSEPMLFTAYDNSPDKKKNTAGPAAQAPALKFQKTQPAKIGGSSQIKPPKSVKSDSTTGKHKVEKDAPKPPERTARGPARGPT